jgi:hypothetical protein
VRRFSRNLRKGLKDSAGTAERIPRPLERPEEDLMSVRPLAFGARLRHGDRTVSVRRREGDTRGYLVEDSGARRATKRRDHVSLDGALRDLARIWRARLH